jgi:hypothetical protein
MEAGCGSDAELSRVPWGGKVHHVTVKGGKVEVREER